MGQAVKISIRIDEDAYTKLTLMTTERRKGALIERLIKEAYYREVTVPTAMEYMADKAEREYR